MSWNWDHMRFFLALADAQTLVSAARQLDVSHTTVLRRIKSFEAELGSRLFEHVHHGYRLTMEGESLYAEAVKMKHVMERVSRQIGGAETQAMGEVTITTTDTLAHEILPPWLVELAEKFAGLRFSLKMRNEFSDIDNYEADIAVRSCKEPPGQLIGRRVGVIRFLACASVEYVRRHALTQFPLDTQGHRFIVLDSAYENTPFNHWLRTRLPRDAYRTTASSPLCAAALCRRGLGISIMPDYMLEGQESLVHLPTNEPIVSNDLWILSHADTRDTERVKIVRHFLQDRLVERFGPG